MTSRARAIRPARSVRIPSGLELCEYIRKNQRLRFVPILMISDRSSPEDMANAEEAGQRLLEEAVHEGQASEIRRRAPRRAARARRERLVCRAAAGDLGDGIDVVYVSPLKALSSDVLKNQDAPLAGIRRAGAALDLAA